MNRIRFYRKFLCCVFAAWLASAAHAQGLEITGIGLSGSQVARDTSVVTGDFVSAVISLTREPGITVEGLALSNQQFEQLVVHYYTTTAPADEPAGSFVETVIPNSVLIDTINIPNTIRFRFRLSSVHVNLIRSIQVEAGIYGLDPNNFQRFSEHRTSHAPLNDIPAVSNPVDILHATYLLYRSTYVETPQIVFPEDSSAASRTLSVTFNLPEPALPRTLIFAFADADSPFTDATRFVYLEDTSPGEDRNVHLNVGNLRDSDGVDSVAGPNSLNHGSIYRILLSYTDLDTNESDADTVEYLTIDTQTEDPVLVQPTSETESSETEIPVVFTLAEDASFVQLRFETEDHSPVVDPLSPHILTLVNDLNSIGLHFIYLDGTNIGTNNPLIVESNNGAFDELVSQALYTVTLAYSDTLENALGVDANSGYMYPRDLATLRPDILAPLPDTREDETFWVQFRLPEEATAGTVQIIFRAPQSPDPGSPHTLTFPTLVAPGTHSLILNAQQFSFSDFAPVVTGPGTDEQNNMLVHNTRYRVIVSYRDHHGNSAAGDSVGLVTYDIDTDDPVILAPSAGDSLSRFGTEVRYNQTELAIPGTLRIILTQTGGPEPDALAPHTLFLSDSSVGFSKQILLQPGSLGFSSGVDSVQPSNNGMLLPLAIYRLSIEYQDTLGNPPGSAYVDGLSLPTGAAVFVEGHGFGSQTVMPGQESMVFRLGLQAYTGTSVLRGLRYLNGGSLQASDVIGSQCHLWSSVDSTFDPELDTPVATLGNWLGGDLVFSVFAVPLTEFETHVFTTLAYSNNADPTRTVNLLLLGPESVDCGGDPVFADQWPIGEADVPLYVDLVSFVADQDTAFGALRLIWTVASEVDNEGFNVLRKNSPEGEFQSIASFTNTPSLTGRGTAPTGWTYHFTDRGLVPGHTYYYRLEAVSSAGFQTVALDLEASGTPRLPPDNFILSDAYPNPFNQEVTIEYVVPSTAVVELFIYDVTGRKVRSLVRALQAASLYKARWDSRDDQGFLVPSGIYLYRFRAGGSFDQTKKLLLIR